MPSTFQIFQSDKAGLNSKESYIVVRGKISFLRILGSDPSWELMTATASEDSGHIDVCVDRPRLIQAAWRLGTEIGVRPESHSDRSGREYVKIGVIIKKKSQDDLDFKNELHNILTRFFELYYSYQGADAKGNSETRELYDALAIDDQGGDVYLGDGIWLSNDGSLKDRSK